MKKCFLPGWTGVGCHLPDCPGVPNCFGRGYCNATNRVTPACTNCDPGWMGAACNDPCIHGTPKDGICHCDPCYTGSGCQSECSGYGECVNNKCVCVQVQGSAHMGEYCELPGCPRQCTSPNNGFCNTETQKCICAQGWTGDDCSTPDCPGEPVCSGHGSCSNTNPRRYDLVWRN